MKLLLKCSNGAFWGCFIKKMKRVAPLAYSLVGWRPTPPAPVVPSASHACPAPHATRRVVPRHQRSWVAAASQPRPYGRSERALFAHLSLHSAFLLSRPRSQPRQRLRWPPLPPLSGYGHSHHLTASPAATIVKVSGRMGHLLRRRPWPPPRSAVFAPLCSLFPLPFACIGSASAS
jgi:hypothetical protein